MVWCNRSTSLSRFHDPRLDSALHFYMGSTTHTNKEYSCWEAEHGMQYDHKLKPSAKQALGSCFVSMNTGSSNRLNMHNFYYLYRLYPSGSFHLASQRLPHLCKKKKTMNEGRWVLQSGRGQLRETGSISAAPPAILSIAADLPSTRQHWPIKALCILQHRPPHWDQSLWGE